MNGMRNYNSGLLRRYRWVMGFFIAALLLSGVTAFPLLSELEALVGTRAFIGDALHSAPTGLDQWLLAIPMGWRWIDCSFGLLGLPPLLYCLSLTRRLKAESES